MPRAAHGAQVRSPAAFLHRLSRLAARIRLLPRPWAAAGPPPRSPVSADEQIAANRLPASPSTIHLLCRPDGRTAGAFPLRRPVLAQGSRKPRSATCSSRDRLIRRRGLVLVVEDSAWVRSRGRRRAGHGWRPTPLANKRCHLPQLIVTHGALLIDGFALPAVAHQPVTRENPFCLPDEQGDDHRRPGQVPAAHRRPSCSGVALARIGAILRRGRAGRRSRPAEASSHLTEISLDCCRSCG
jgi:hypothetical protein